MRPSNLRRLAPIALAVSWGLASWGLASLGLASCRPADAPGEGAAGEPVADASAGPGFDRRLGTAHRPRREVTEVLRADLEAPRHPADGGGRAWLETAGDLPAVPGAIRPVTAGARGRFVIDYEAGPFGIADGGRLFLQISPFWGWSTPQVGEPRAPGYTEVTTSAAGVDLVAETLDQQLLGLRISGRALTAGERIRLIYGAGAAGAATDRFAERRSRFWIGVDGDGDGVRAWLADPPAVDVVPGPPARLLLTLPSTARPGDTVRLHLAVLDRAGNTGVPVAGTVALRDVAGGRWAGLPPTVRFTPEDAGRRQIDWTLEGVSGVVRLRGEGSGGAAGLVAESNPLEIREGAMRVLWGDLQAHSGYSDGTALPEELFVYARDVAALDVFALTDHDHWGLRFLDQEPAMWEEIRRLTERFHEPGRFVTFLGFEWTSWIHGHRHVLYFDGDGEVLSSLDPRWDHPEKLWAALAGTRALTIAHHSAGGPITVDWTIPPDPEREPVTEIVSVHGSSEAIDSPSLIHRPVPGSFVRDALDRGYRFGFLGSTDGHDGHPGLAHLASPSGGVAAILAEDATREAVWAALVARRVYATSGPRILLRASLGGWRMGEEVPLEGGDGGTTRTASGPVAGVPANTLVVRAIAPGELERIDVVRPAGVASVLCDGEKDCAFSSVFADLAAGEYLYVRVVQRDGGLAFSSPFFLVDAQDLSS